MGGGGVAVGDFEVSRAGPALAPIRDAQRKAIVEYKSAMVEHEARHGEWEEANKKLRGPEPTPPVCSRIAVSDTTVEALADRLQAALRGLLCERDELSGWLKSFNQYKAKGGADVAHWLTMHRAGGLLMDRKTGDQKIIFCPMAFVAVAGTVQPGTLRRCLTPEYRESGLAARLLLAMPPVRRRQWSEATVSEPLSRGTRACWWRCWRSRWAARCWIRHRWICR